MTRNATKAARPLQNAPARSPEAGPHTPDVPSAVDGFQALQQTLGNQAIQRLAKSGTLNAQMVSATRFGLGNQGHAKTDSAEDRPSGGLSG